MKEIVMQLETLGCPTCAKKIETALKKTEGVTSVEVLFNASKAVVTATEQTTPEMLSSVVNQLGYQVESFD